MKLKLMCRVLSAMGLAAAASPATATTLLSDSMGTLVINPVTDTGSLSASTTLIYKYVPAVTKIVKGKKVIITPATSTLSYAINPGPSGIVKGITPAAQCPAGVCFDATQIDYTFKIASPVQLLYGQVLNTVQGSKVALGSGDIQLWDLTTDKSLTPLVNLTLTGNQNSATTANYSIDLFDTDDLYALRVIGNVPVRRTSTSQINVQYSPSVFATAVPEPATWALMILGIGGAGVALRRRATRAAAIAA